MSKGYMYILECSDGSYYTGSTKNLERRLWEHQHSLGANYTRKRLPVKLVYFEEYDRIEDAFRREKQVQGWSRRKKQALIEGWYQDLPGLAKSYASTGSATTSTSSATTSKKATTSSATASKNSTTGSTKATTSSTSGSTGSRGATVSSTSSETGQAQRPDKLGE